MMLQEDGALARSLAKAALPKLEVRRLPPGQGVLQLWRSMCSGDGTAHKEAALLLLPDGIGLLPGEGLLEAGITASWVLSNVHVHVHVHASMGALGHRGTFHCCHFGSSARLHVQLCLSVALCGCSMPPRRL